MKATIDIKSGQVQAVTEPDHVSESLMLFGRIDRLHAGEGAGWSPRVEDVEGYLRASSGPEFVKHLPSIEGKYVAIWRDGSHLYVFCDRFSQQMAYYRLSGDVLELFDRILDDKRPLVVEQANALAFMLLQFVPGRETLFDGIRRLMPGDCLVVDTAKGELRVEQSCAYPLVDVEADLDDEGVSDRLHGLFREAIEMRLRRYGEDEPILLPLSGGLDSRCLLGTALELVPSSRIIATTFGQPGSYDFEIGRKVAQAVGVRHLAYPLSPADYKDDALEANCRDTDGQINFVTEAPMRVFYDLAQYGRVVLSGYNADAIMGGHASPARQPTPRENILRNAYTRIDPHDPVTKYLDGKVEDRTYYYEGAGPSSLHPSEVWYFFNRGMKYQSYCVLKHREVFGFMAPFDDFAFTTFVLNQPPYRRYGRRLEIGWLRRHFSVLASLPCRMYRGVPLDALPAEKWLAREWDGFQYHALGINRRVTKIDFFKHRREILAPEKLRAEMAGVLPKEFEEIIFGSDRYYLLLYNLKCLGILAKHFDAKFG